MRKPGRVVALTPLYVDAWSLEFDLDKDPFFLTLPENYPNRFSISTIEDSADMVVELFKRYYVNGMIMFMNRSHKVVSSAYTVYTSALKGLLPCDRILYR